MRHLPPGIGALCSVAVLALLTLAPAPAEARDGFWLGVGGAQTTVAGDLDGTRSFSDPSGIPNFIAGKMNTGDGTAASIGYGVGRWFAFEYLYEDTSHRASSSLTPDKSNAEFIAQVFGVRLTVPFGEKYEGFLRWGYGVYEADYSTYSFFGQTLNQTGKVAFTGTGASAGGGFEFYFGHVSVGLGYTLHHYVLNKANPQGGQKLDLPTNLTGIAATTDLLLAYHF